MNKYTIEFIGTFFLLLTVALTGNPLAIGGVLAAMVYMGGYISGGHYNPAVTLAVKLRGAIDSKTMYRYWGAQIAGAIVASLVYFTLKEKSFVPAPSDGVGFISAFMTEAIFTFVLCFTVLHVATSKQTKGNQYYGLAIGFILMVGAFAGGPISGGVYNPAIGIGTILVDFPNITNHLSNLGLYIVGPAIGGILASLVYKTS